ncbi:hypothetical protein SIL85_02760 [Shewanella oneidensis]|uniref:Uncharacterized protein n=1 Tax=Shewanella oneidensis (strain ATCC 700550 / JCM 31522 / CIP 106686 / LMG 19005 / NCIMB 14063 / MR-1) TaxID=211586 RepID=K4PSG1_SHEON|nr:MULTISPECIES: hypothetical protein [Shewanella]AFV73543.1 uncharacterized protein SO_4822 [Shewanella oneidensis MR-1]MDX5996005.1 hypothetical protein [Shewanella oneidensis]
MYLDNTDIIIIAMLIGLILLHCLFAARVIKSQVSLSTNQKCLWCLLSLLLGPIGYYAYHGLIPLDKLQND